MTLMNQWIREKSRHISTPPLPFSPPSHPTAGVNNASKSIMCSDWNPIIEGLLLLGSENGQTHIINCRQNPYQSEDPLLLPQHMDPVVECKWSPSASHFATSISTSIINYHSSQEPLKPLRIYNNESSAKKILFRTDTQFLSCFRDGSIQLFDIRDPSMLPKLSLRNLHSLGLESTLTDISYHYLSSDIIMSIGHPNYDLKMWDLRYTWKGDKSIPIEIVPLPILYSPYIKKRMRAPLAIINNPQKSSYHCVCADDTIYTHSITNNAVIHRMMATDKFRTSGSFFLGASLSPDGDMLVCGSSEEGGGAFIWDGIGSSSSRNKNFSLPKWRLGECRWEASCVSWSGNFLGKERIFVGGEDYLSRIWTIDDCQYSIDSFNLKAEPLFIDNCDITQQQTQQQQAQQIPQTIEKWPSQQSPSFPSSMMQDIIPLRQINQSHFSPKTVSRFNKDFLLLFN